MTTKHTGLLRSGRRKTDWLKMLTPSADTLVLIDSVGLTRAASIAIAQTIEMAECADDSSSTDDIERLLRARRILFEVDACRRSKIKT